jgi:uncharacterized protein YdaU (DUF1376 family)
MMSFPFMPFYIGDHLRDTRHLTAEQQGAYLLLIFEYWSKGSLPDGDEHLARIASLSPAKWRKMKPVIQAFFYDSWHHKRIDAELAKAHAKSRTNTARARKAATVRWAETEQREHADPFD